MSDETYWVTTNSRRSALHTDKDCRQLNQANGIREARTGEVRDLPVCRWCRGVVEMDHGPHEHQMALKRAAEND